MTATEYDDLLARFDLLDLAHALADVDDPGAWWTLDSAGRDRYEAMARVAFDLIGGDEPDDDELEEAQHAGFREALALLTSFAAVLCLDCDENTAALGEGYMLRDEVWLEANPGDEGMLCVGCVERRLGRRLRSDDFTDAPLNRQPCSARLRSRREEEPPA